MSWSDLFYPANPERREKLIRKSQEVQELMKNNFRVTNQLIEVMNKYLGLSFSPIALNEKTTVKENCDVIIQCIHEIQAEVKKIDEKLKEKLEPTLYEKLKNMSLSIPEFELLKSAFHAAVGIGGFVSVAAFLINWLYSNLHVFNDMIEGLDEIGKALFGIVLLGVLFLGIDMIVQAILGSIERDQLESALEEYDKALENFRPASEKYQDQITEVKISLQMRQNAITSTI